MLMDILFYSDWNLQDRLVHQLTDKLAVISGQAFPVPVIEDTDSDVQ